MKIKNLNLNLKYHQKAQSRKYESFMSLATYIISEKKA